MKANNLPGVNKRTNKAAHANSGAVSPTKSAANDLGDATPSTAAGSPTKASPQKKVDAALKGFWDVELVEQKDPSTPKASVSSKEVEVSVADINGGSPKAAAVPLRLLSVAAAALKGSSSRLRVGVAALSAAERDAIMICSTLNSFLIDSKNSQKGKKQKQKQPQQQGLNMDVVSTVLCGVVKPMIMNHYFVSSPRKVRKPLLAITDSPRLLAITDSPALLAIMNMQASTSTVSGNVNESSDLPQLLKEQLVWTPVAGAAAVVATSASSLDVSSLDAQKLRIRAPRKANAEATNQFNRTKAMLLPTIKTPVPKLLALEDLRGGNRKFSSEGKSDVKSKTLRKPLRKLSDDLVKKSSFSVSEIVAFCVTTSIVAIAVLGYFGKL